MFQHYFYVKHVKCAGCNASRTYDGQGLRLRHGPGQDFKLLLACSSSCAQKILAMKRERQAQPIREDVEQESMMTKNGPIPYRKITQTHK